jgi:hypothetical protein
MTDTIESTKARVAEELQKLGRGESYLFLKDAEPTFPNLNYDGSDFPAEYSFLEPLVANLACVKDVPRPESARLFRIGEHYVITSDSVPDYGDSSSAIVITTLAGEPLVFGHVVDGKPETLEWGLELGVGKLN